MAEPIVSSLDTIRVDQVGSLLRPRGLRDVYDKHDAGDITDEELTEAQDAAIRDVFKAQASHGVAVQTDGEFRRLNFQDSMAASVAGFAASAVTAAFYEHRSDHGAPMQRIDPGYSGDGPAVIKRRPVVAPLALAYNLPLEEFRFSSQVAKAPVKVTLIGPDRVMQRYAWEDSADVYSDLDAFAADLVRVQREMVSSLVDAGCPYVHIDEPGYTAYVDEPSLAEMRARGENPFENMRRGIAADNAVIAGFPGTTFGVHLCRGNQRSMWHREGTYDAIAEELFSTLGHQRLLLEYDSDRAGTFAPLRFVPKGKVVVLGLVSTKVAGLEDGDELKRRIEEASRHLPLEQLALSPQCGFASDISGNLLSDDDQWAKLELVQRVAADVWG